MALDGVQRNGGTPKTVEQLLHADNPIAWNASSGLGGIHDQEEDHLNHARKLSVLAKMKEKAKKWRQTLVRKRHGNDAYHTPSWGVALEDYEVEEDPKYNGSHHPASGLVFSEKRSTSSTLRRKSTAGRPSLTKSHSNHEGDISSLPRVRTHETLRARSFSQNDGENRSSLSKEKEKLVCSEATLEGKVQHPSDSKTTTDGLINKRYEDEEKENMFTPRNTIEEIDNSPRSPWNVDQEMAENERSKPLCSCRMVDQEVERPSHSLKKISETESGQDNNVMFLVEEIEKQPSKMKAITEVVSGKLAPAYATVSEATSKITSKIQGLSIASLEDNGEARKWDKGVSVTEYFKNKLEPGEDERALSQVISEVMSPRRSPTEKGVVEKMKTAVTLLFQREEPSASSSSMKTSECSSRIPLSTNAHEVEEENQGRVLQAN